MDTILPPATSIDVGGPDFRLRGQDQIGVAAKRGSMLAVKEQRRADIGNRIATDNPQPDVVSVLRLEAFVIAADRFQHPLSDHRAGTVGRQV